MIALINACKDRAVSFAAHQSLWHQQSKGGIGAADIAIAIQRYDGHRRLVEEAGKAHFCGAQIFGWLFTRCAIDDQSARGAGRAILRKGNAMNDAHGHALTIAAFEVDIELFGAHFA